MLATSTKAFLFTLILASSVLGNVERSACSGAENAGYCCNGSIIPKDHSNDLDAGHYLCCQGDPHIQVLNGANAPTSCTAGTQIPLTQASSASQTSGSSDSTASSSSSSSASANNAARAMITNAPFAGAAAMAGGLFFGL